PLTPPLTFDRSTGGSTTVSPLQGASARRGARMPPDRGPHGAAATAPKDTPAPAQQARVRLSDARFCHKQARNQPAIAPEKVGRSRLGTTTVSATRLRRRKG